MGSGRGQTNKGEKGEKEKQQTEGQLSVWVLGARDIPGVVAPLGICTGFDHELKACLKHA